MSAVQAQGIVKSFGRQRVLNQIDLIVPAGQFVAIIGPSGCGKSTLLKIITCLLAPDQGQILVFDKDINRLGRSQLNQLRKRLGMVFQQSPLLDQRDIAGNLRLLFEYTNIDSRTIEARIAEVLAQVNLSGYEHKMPGQLSGGERKRTAIACAIVGQPELMLYDEPTLSLDPDNKNLVIQLMTGLHHSSPHQITSLVVSHDLDILPLADSVLFMQGGRLHHLGPGRNLTLEYLKRLFANQVKLETRKEAT
jgi:ABC-type transporter Mla maintaining outer membrane lipid asymmetry ATPase subunit MlaF